MQNKTILITGSTNGLGKEMTKLLAQNNNLILLGRNEELLLSLSKELLTQTKYNIDYFVCDFSVILDVYNAVSDIKLKYDSIDIIINNAGALLRPNKDEVHPSLLVNYISPLVLNELLLELLLKSSDPTIFYTTTMALPNEINVNAISNMSNKNKIKAYSLSKAAFNMFLIDLSNKNNIKIKVFDPKIIYTNAVKTTIPKLFRWLFPITRLFAKKANKVAIKGLNVLKDESDKKIQYYRLDKRVVQPKKLTSNLFNVDETINWTKEFVSNIKK